MKPKFSILTFLFICFILLTPGCKQKQESTEPALTKREAFICDSLKIDSTVIKEIRKYNSSTIEPFHYSLGKSFSNGVETEIDPIHLQGIVFTEVEAEAKALVQELRIPLREKGYSIFVLDQKFNINKEPDVLAVLKTTDKFEVLKQIQTNGINYDITNDSLISIIKKYDQKYSLDLIGASGDWCEFIINKEPADWEAFAKEVYAVCPDVVDQGTGDIKTLAEEMKRTKTLYFWWD